MAIFSGSTPPPLGTLLHLVSSKRHYEFRGKDEGGKFALKDLITGVIHLVKAEEICWTPLVGAPKPSVP